MSQPPDHYATLGLDPRAEDVVVQAAWRAMLRKYHPDTNRAPDAQAHTHAINEAYAVLSDPKARRIYDRDRITHVVSLSFLEPRRRSRRRLGLALALALAATALAALYLFAPATAARLQDQVTGHATTLGQKIRIWRDQLFPGEHHPPPVENID